ncbi:uncharacterized protein LOC141530714 [Cotesia typhae]|uniref:uncharacterized protein LOC141530714 n=1 Tax=Cotesia typhae TaxID=2053667 RepID=UPI003D69505F
MELDLALLRDQRQQESFNTNLGLSRPKESLDTLMSKSGDKIFNNDNTVDTPLSLDKSASNNSKIETSLEISSTNTSKNSSLNIKSRRIGQRSKRKRVLSINSDSEDYSHEVNPNTDLLESNKLTFPLKPASEIKILEKLPMSKQTNHQFVKTDSTVNENTSKNDLILKYFKSISKQIGHLNSQVILNTAELKDIKQYITKKCSCNESDSNEEEVINDDNNIDNENPEAGDNGKKKKEEFKFPIDDKDKFIKFNEQI